MADSGGTAFGPFPFLSMKEIIEFHDKKWLHFTVEFDIILPTQGSYIGNTTASQAVKAGSIPVPCST